MSMISKDELKQYVTRIQRLEEEKANTSNDIKEVYSEAKSMGFDPVIMKKVIALMKKDPAEREEEEGLLEVYLNALDI